MRKSPSQPQVLNPHSFQMPQPPSPKSLPFPIPNSVLPSAIFHNLNNITEGTLVSVEAIQPIISIFLYCPDETWNFFFHSLAIRFKKDATHPFHICIKHVNLIRHK